MTLANSYPIRLVCRLLGVPRSSVYYMPQPAADEAMLKTVSTGATGLHPPTAERLGRCTGYGVEVG
jgi:hypothetical protein